jgi:hypothetical protein
LGGTDWLYSWPRYLRSVDGELAIVTPGGWGLFLLDKDSWIRQDIQGLWTAATLEVLGGRAYCGGSYATMIDGEVAPYMVEWRPEPNPPIVGMFSSDVLVREGLQTTLTLPVEGALPATIRWFRNGTEIVNPRDFTNATFRIGSTPPDHFAGTPAQVWLSLYSTRKGDAGSYSFEISNPCGTIRGGPISLGVTCGGDFNGDGEVNPTDIIEFLGAWFEWRSEANVDGRYGCYVGDLMQFLTFYFEGCR